jgi:O-succinylbenzoic acid--CoA ligase
VTRSVELLHVPTGPGLLALLPRLADALSGRGPALAPVAAGDTAQIALLSKAFEVGAPLARHEDDPADPTAIVIATSGSTGPPKGTLLPRSALAASAAATQARLGPVGCWLLALPAQHIAGLQVLLRSMATASEPHIMDTGLPFTAERFTEAVDRLPPGPRYVSLVPTQLHRVLQHETATTALRTFDGVLVGGSATPERLLQLARQAGVSVVTTYGMSETCGGCVYDGRPLAGTEVKLDENGRVVLSGAMVGRGYRNMPGHPAFGMAVAPPGVATGPRTTGSASFRTDDLGEWVDGRLQILGRVDDVIVTGGLKIAPTRLEAAIAGVAVVAEAVVVGVPDPEWGQRVAAVVVAADPRNPPRLDDLRRACSAAGIGDALLPRSLTLVDALPSRGPGKPDRAAATALAGAELARAAPLPH